ncbi:pyridoxal phosphate homeostasis protein [Ditylenchus destructor]|nr:pyridoxal phosphate homeostasis protein [Ditylenchus destructor]
MEKSDDSSMIAQNLSYVLQRIGETATRYGIKNHPRLVAVSKTKPKEMVVSCYEQGQRHFGENYSQELEEKSSQLLSTCPDIKWHFIGHIQSNKVKKLCKIPNLWCVETLDSQKHMDLFQKAVEEEGRPPLNVFIQVNTSGETNKGGVEMENAPMLAKYVIEKCPNLHLLGLMTIGALDESANREKNADFSALVEVRRNVSEAIGRPVEDCELSMGMTNDYELAIQYGSTNVRVGSAIFGARNYATTNQ